MAPRDYRKGKEGYSITVHKQIVTFQDSGIEIHIYEGKKWGGLGYSDYTKASPMTSKEKLQ